MKKNKLTLILLILVIVVIILGLSIYYVVSNNRDVSSIEFDGCIKVGESMNSSNGNGLLYIFYPNANKDNELVLSKVLGEEVFIGKPGDLGYGVWTKGDTSFNRSWNFFIKDSAENKIIKGVASKLSMFQSASVSISSPVIKNDGDLKLTDFGSIRANDSFKCESEY